VLSEFATDKFFEIRILTPKPLRLKILRGILAKPAPDKPFTVLGEGSPPARQEFRFRNQFRKAREDSETSFFSWKSTGRALARKLLRDRTIQVNRFMQLPLLDVLTFGMRDVNRSRTDQQRFAPIR